MGARRGGLSLWVGGAGGIPCDAGGVLFCGDALVVGVVCAICGVWAGGI